MNKNILEKVETRLKGDDTFEASKIEEYVNTIVDRLCILLNENELPEKFYSIAADAAVKMHRRFYYEGVQSENDGGVSISFVDNILLEYENEIKKYNADKYKRIRFL